MVRLMPIEAGHSAWLAHITVTDTQRIYVDDRSAADAYREFLQAQQNGIRCQQYFIMKDRVPVGVVTLSYLPCAAFEPDMPGMCCYLGRLMIDAAQQGQGIGGIAVAEVLALCRARIFGEAAYCYLSCNRESLSGIRIYEKNGFQKLDIDYDEAEDLYRASI